MSEQDKDALRCADALMRCESVDFDGDFAASAAHIRRLVAEREKDRAVMRHALEALNTCTPGDYSTGHVVPPSFDDSAVDAAISALTELVGEV